MIAWFQIVADWMHETFNLSNFRLARYLAILPCVGSLVVHVYIAVDLPNLLFAVMAYVPNITLHRNVSHLEKQKLGTACNPLQMFFPYGLLRLVILNTTAMLTLSLAAGLPLNAADRTFTVFMWLTCAAFYFAACTPRPPKILKQATLTPALVPQS